MAIWNFEPIDRCITGADRWWSSKTSSSVNLIFFQLSLGEDSRNEAPVAPKTEAWQRKRHLRAGGNPTTTCVRLISSSPRFAVTTSMNGTVDKSRATLPSSRKCSFRTREMHTAWCRGFDPKALSCRCWRDMGVSPNTNIWVPRIRNTTVRHWTTSWGAVGGERSTPPDKRPREKELF